MKAPLSLLPFIPSGPDFEASRQFFNLIGFQESWDNDGYIGFEMGPAKFILQDFNNKEFADNLMVKIEVDDVDIWWEEFQPIAQKIATEFPSARINPPKDFPWGREVHFIDLAVVCWHVCRP